MLDAPSYEKKQILFAFLNQGEKVSFLNDNLVIRNSDGKIKCQSTCYRLFALYIVGHTSITTGLIQRASQFGFTIILMTTGFRVYQIIGSHRDANTALHRIQYQYNRWDIAQYLTANKIRSQRETLNIQRNKSPELKNAIAFLDSCPQKLQNANSLDEIMGIEGAAARLYFENHFNNVPWTKRMPRIKPDWVNSTLDIGYTILFSFIESLLSIYGFDLYCGVMHRQFYMRKSLVCDLVEPFRPVIDQQIKKSINLGQFKVEHFKVFNHQYQLEWKHSPVYTSVILQSLLQRRSAIFKYVQSYYRAFMRDKPIDQYPVFYIEKE